MRIFAITIGDTNAASTHYRILQYLPMLAQAGMQITVVARECLTLKHLQAMAQADVVINQKTLLPTLWRWAIRVVAKKLIFDWDDAVWTRPNDKRAGFTRWRVKNRLHGWLKSANKVFSANSYLNAYALKYNRHAVVLPMAIDLEHFRPKAAKTFDPEAPILGWAGAPQNLGYVAEHLEVLQKFLERHPKAKLKILCGEKPNWNIPFEHTPWSKGAEASFLEGVDVGVMPMPENDPFSLGKSPIKALHYMAMGLPVVGHMNVGGACDIAQGGGCISVKNKEDFIAALEKLMDTDFYNSQSQAALANARKNHDQRVVFERMVALWSGRELH